MTHPLSEGNLAEWALANAFNQKFEMENAHLSKQLGTQIKSIPFGSHVSVNQQSWLGGLGQVALAALGLGAGGLGLAHLMGLFGGAHVPPAVPVEPAPIVQPAPVNETPRIVPKEIPLTIEWEFIPDDNSSIEFEGGHSSSSKTTRERHESQSGGRSITE